MKLAYIGIDLLYPALPALEEAGCDILAVYSCKTDNRTEFNTKVTRYARERNIPFSLAPLKTQDVLRLKGEGCEVILCGGYYHRIPVSDALPMLNIHPSLLPIGRGAWPMPLSILRGESFSGVTIHKMTEAFDQGDILMQQVVSIAPDETLLSLTNKQCELLPAMLKALVGDFHRLYRDAKPQGPGEYWPCPREEEYPIDKNTPREEADRILRAFYGYQCVYHQGERGFGLIFGELCPPNETGTGLFSVLGGSIKAKQVEVLW